MQVFIKTQIHHLKQSMAYNEPWKFIKSYTIIFDVPKPGHGKRYQSTWSTTDELLNNTHA